MQTEFLSMSKISEEKPVPPKRPLSAFFLYKNDIYDIAKMENPLAQMTDLTKIISYKWKGDMSLRDEYEKKHSEEKKIYTELKKDYERKYGKIQKKPSVVYTDTKDNDGVTFKRVRLTD